jgi:cyanophycinase
MSGGRRGSWSAPNDRKLLVIGGAEGHSESDDAILERFVSLAGGASARIVVIATASECPELREKEYAGVFQRFGVAEVTALRLEARERSNSDEAVAIVERATGVFFTGGDQLRITTVLGGSKVDSVLHQRLAQGLVLAGTSAGAAMMSSTMILGGKDAAVTTSSVRTGPGMEFLPGVLIDMHFAERGRLNRLLSAVAMFPHELGLGIDENTAILVEGNRFEVLGAGSVTVIDAGPATTIKTPEDSTRSIALCGVQLHVLPAGFVFDLTERQAHVGVPVAEPADDGD